MISKYSHKTLNWIDLEAPKEEEVLHVIDLCSIPEFIKNEIFIRSKEDKIILEHGYIFASLKMPQALPDEINNSKMIFVVCDNFILTIHNEKILGLNKFSKEMELDIIEEEKIDNNKLLFAYLIKNLFTSAGQQLVDNDIKIFNLKNQITQKNKKLKNLTKFIMLLIVLLIIFIWL